MRHGWQPRAPDNERPAGPPDRIEPGTVEEEKGMPHFAGVDWGGTTHAVCVVDGDGRVVARFEAAHTAGGLAELRSKLARFGAAAGLPVAIERPSGLLVDTLLEAGHPVVPIHP